MKEENIYRLHDVILNDTDVCRGNTEMQDSIQPNEIGVILLYDSIRP